MEKYNLLNLYERYKKTTLYKNIPDIIELTLPLSKICDFALMQYDANDRLIWLIKDEDDIEWYLKNPESFYDDPAGCTPARLLNPGEYHYTSHGCYKGLCIIRDYENGGRDMFFFEKINPNFNNYDLLYAFTHEFKDKAKTMLARSDKIFVPLACPTANTMNIFNRIKQLDFHTINNHHQSLLSPDQINYCKCLQMAGQYGLTDRETQCLRLLTQGKLNKQMADVLNLSPKSIEAYIYKVKCKLNCYRKNDIATKILFSDLSANQIEPISLPASQPNAIKNFCTQTSLNQYLQIIRNHNLTNRESQCLNLITQGKMNKQIADQMNISIKTIDAYVDKIKTKLRCRNKIEIITKMANLCPHYNEQLNIQL